MQCFGYLCSPGLMWEKTKEGWRRVRVPGEDHVVKADPTAHISTVNTSYRSRPRDLIGCVQPFVFVARTVSKQVVIEKTSITEVLDKLDFVGAVKDIRRHRYVCKLLESLIQQKFPQLSGMAQKKVMLIMDAILDEALETETNLHVIHSMAEVTQKALVDGCHYHMGGKRLWDQHFERVGRIQSCLHDFELTERDDDGVTLTDIPDDVLREILLKLSDHSDLLTVSQVDTRLQDVAVDEKVWKELSLYHFGEQITPYNIVKARKEGWKTVYRILLSRFPLREEYAEQLCICSHCNALFWQLHGHPCLESKAESEDPPQEFTLTPQEMILRFS